MPLNHYKRIQDITIGELYPSIPGFCAFKCGKPLIGKRTRWCSDLCCRRAGYQLAIKMEIPDIIRSEVQKRDKDKDGKIFCKNCGCPVGWDFTNHKEIKWDADHIIAVVNGGGGLGLSNYRIVCKPCHRLKTKEDLKTKRNKK